MNKQNLVVGDSPKISVKIGGDLKLNGWDKAEISVELSSGGGRGLEQIEEGYRIDEPGSAEIWAPANAHLQIIQVDGDAEIGSLAGLLEIEKIGGDLILEQVGAVSAGRIGGDLDVEGATGDLTIQKVGGDASIEHVSGFIRVEKVGGELHVQGGSGLQASIGGDTSVELAGLSQTGSRVRTGGDLSFVLPDDAQARLQIRSGGEDITLRLPGQMAQVERHNYQGTLGNGQTEVTLEAGGDVFVATQGLRGTPAETPGEDLSGLGEQISRRVHEQLRSAGIDIPDEDLYRQAFHKVEQKVKHADRRIRVAMRRLHQLDQDAGPLVTPPQASAAAPVGEPATDEERMLILQMVEDKKISVEEAEKLLEAIEGMPGEDYES